MVKSPCCSSRGLEFSSCYPYQSAHKLLDAALAEDWSLVPVTRVSQLTSCWNSSSSASDASGLLGYLHTCMPFSLPPHLHAHQGSLCLQAYTCVRTYTHHQSLHQSNKVLLFHTSSFLPKGLAITALFTDSIILPSPVYWSWIHCLLRPDSTSKILLCSIALIGTEHCYLHR